MKKHKICREVLKKRGDVVGCRQETALFDAGTLQRDSEIECAYHKSGTRL